MSDSITILRCARGLRLAKLIRADGVIISYDDTRTFDAWTVPILGLADIGDLLTKIIYQPRVCVVRGDLTAGGYVRRMRRLLHQDKKTGDNPTLIDVPHLWLAIDVEGIKRPAHVDPADLHACAFDVLRHFPRAFRTAACIVQASASHGLKPDHRLRLWFWLSRPITGAEAKRWLKGCPADPSIFNAAQCTYTAAPVFEGCSDHLPQRLAAIAGTDAVAVPAPEKLAPSPRRQEKQIPDQDTPGANAYAQAILRNAGIRVSHAAENSRHPTCMAQARKLARFVSAGILSASDVKDVMGRALAEAGKTKEEGEMIACWALDHEGVA